MQSSLRKIHYEVKPSAERLRTTRRNSRVLTCQPKNPSINSIKDSEAVTLKNPVARPAHDLQPRRPPSPTHLWKLSWVPKTTLGRWSKLRTADWSPTSRAFPCARRGGHTFHVACRETAFFTQVAHNFFPRGLTILSASFMKDV